MALDVARCPSLPVVWPDGSGKVMRLVKLTFRAQSNLPVIYGRDLIMVHVVWRQVVGAFATFHRRRPALAQHRRSFGWSAPLWCCHRPWYSARPATGPPICIEWLC